MPCPTFFDNYILLAIGIIQKDKKSKHNDMKRDAKIKVYSNTIIFLEDL